MSDLHDLPRGARERPALPGPHGAQLKVMRMAGDITLVDPSNSSAWISADPDDIVEVGTKSGLPAVDE